MVYRGLPFWDKSSLVEQGCRVSVRVRNRGLLSAIGGFVILAMFVMIVGSKVDVGVVSNRGL